MWSLLLGTGPRSGCSGGGVRPRRQQRQVGIGLRPAALIPRRASKTSGVGRGGGVVARDLYSGCRTLSLNPISKGGEIPVRPARKPPKDPLQQCKWLDCLLCSEQTGWHHRGASSCLNPGSASTKRQRSIATYLRQPGQAGVAGAIWNNGPRCHQMYGACVTSFKLENNLQPGAPDKIIHLISGSTRLQLLTDAFTAHKSLICTPSVPL